MARARGARRKRTAIVLSVGVGLVAAVATVTLWPSASTTTAARSMASTPRTVTTTNARLPVAPPERPGSFRVECRFSHQAHADPIVSPGVASHHMHDFFGNESTKATSDYASMRGADTTCTADGDRASYWAPALVAPDGTFVEPERGIFYYRNRPTPYGTTTPFPPDFRMIAGGAFPNAYWTCDGDSDTGFEDRRRMIPDCDHGVRIKLHVFFPSCWDGTHLDSRDHRSHVAYGIDKKRVPDGTNPKRCPASHPVKLPQLDFRVLYPVSDGTRYELADGGHTPHADFWNTWDQPDLEQWVERCLREGNACRLAED